MSNEKFDIRKLYVHQKKKSEQKKELYESVVKKVHHRIEAIASRSETQCLFQVPEFMLGMPLYDSFQCSGYVIERLKKEGFHIQYMHPNCLHIDWSKELIEPFVEEIEKKEKMNNSNHKKNINTTGLTDFTSLLSSPPEQKQTMDYKPTGKLFDI